MSDELAATFERVLGFEPPKAKEILKNTKVASSLNDIVAESGLSVPPSSTAAALLHNLASLSKDTPANSVNRKLVIDAIVSNKIKSAQQLSAGWEYVVKAGDKATAAELDKEAGVGVEVTEAEIKQYVGTYFADNKSDIEEKRYKGVPAILSGVKSIPQLKWANFAQVKAAVDAAVLETLGPKDDRDLVKKPAKAAKTPAKSAKANDAAATPPSARSMFTEGFLGSLHKPGENTQVYPERMKEHLAFTEGRVFTRFPPEPNGYLHIGHSKAIAINFGFAQFHHGECYLRFDDTNPEAEEEKYFTAIRDIVDWLGFKPFKVTYSSDYFDQLYELAEQLVKNGLAYVCYCTPEEVKAHRGQSEDGTKGGERTACEHRSASVEKNLEEFRKMRDGAYEPGKATLRMKQDLSDPNPQMWDLVAYRVLKAHHHRTGDKWKIYPTYDFTHCLVDSMENISHSLCTLEFFLSRTSYDWLCNALKVYRPQQRESGRLNLTGTVMSKRKILKLVNDGIVRDWDDPRLFTLVAIRRRGVPPGAVLSFVAELGVTTSNANIQVTRFDNSIRKYLEDSTPRLMMVLDPVVVIIDNLPDDYAEEVSVPFKPDNAQFGEHTVPFTKRVYIDRSDFREEKSKGYFRLAPGQSVGLVKVPFTITYVSHKTDTEGRVVEIHAKYDNDGSHKKPKTYIQWVADSPKHQSPVKIAEVRVFNQLFKSENPLANPDGYLADLNPDSETIYRDAIIETGFHEVRKRSPWQLEGAGDEAAKVLSGNDKAGSPESVRFQALRVGYFCLDKDSKDDALVLNRIVTLKEDTAKN